MACPALFRFGGELLTGHPELPCVREVQDAEEKRGGAVELHSLEGLCQVTFLNETLLKNVAA